MQKLSSDQAWSLVLKINHLWISRIQHPSLEAINMTVHTRTLMLKLKLQYFGCLTGSIDSLGKKTKKQKKLMLGKIEGRGRRGQQMVGWHHQLNGHEFEQALGDSEGQESLGRCSPWGGKESDTTERPTDNNKRKVIKWS